MQTLAAQSRVRARQDRARLDWASVVQLHLFHIISSFLREGIIGAKGTEYSETMLNREIILYPTVTPGNYS